MPEKFDYITHYKTDSEEFDYFEERTGATEHDERRVHEYILSNVNDEVSSILDVGSGSAWVAKHFNDKNMQIFSFDISKTNVQKAKSLVNTNMHIPIVGDSFNLPFKDEAIEVVIASEIIEHVIDPRKFVKELLRVVKPNGKVIITTPYKEKLRYYLCVHCNKKTPVHAHLHSFDENILKSFTPDNNTNYEYQTFGNKLLIFLRTYVILKYLPFRLWKLVDSVFNLIKSMPVHIIVKYHK